MNQYCYDVLVIIFNEIHLLRPPGLAPKFNEIPFSAAYVWVGHDYVYILKISRLKEMILLSWNVHANNYD